MTGPGQTRDDSQSRYAGPGQGWHDSQTTRAGPGQSPNDGHPTDAGPGAWSPIALADLRAAGENLADLIKVRTAADNRARTLGHLDTELIRPVWVAEAEVAAREALQDAYLRAIPEHIREWAAQIPGLATGEMFPRIIAAIGDPCTAAPLLPIAKGDTGRGARSRPAGPPYARTPHQLWQYCGIGEPWHPDGDVSQSVLLHAGKRTRVRPLLFAWSASLARMAGGETPRSPAATASDYWKVVTERQRETRGHDGPCPPGRACYGTHYRHTAVCRNRARPPQKPNGCGIALHPEWGEPGSPWRPGHVQADAYRAAAKALLMDLWRTEQATRSGPNPRTAERRARRKRAR